MALVVKLYCHDPEHSPFSEIASCREDRTKPDENKDSGLLTLSSMQMNQQMKDPLGSFELKEGLQSF